MSRRNGKSPKLDLKLNLSPPARGSTSRAGAFAGGDSRNRSSSSSPMSSPPSSCVSSESEQGKYYSSDDDHNKKKKEEEEEATSMVLVGCPRCLMYVMLSAEENPRCPKCKSTVLLDFLNDPTNSNTTTRKN